MKLFCPIFVSLLPDNNRCSCKERHLKKKGSEMDTNELKQRQHFILIRTLLVVTALALLVYIAFLWPIHPEDFKKVLQLSNG